MNQKTIGLAGLTLFISLALSGCSLNTSSDPNHMDHDGMTHETADFSNADIMFAQMMIPHHQQAVDMGTLAETRALDSHVKELAAQIKAEQAPEISQMQAWLVSSGSDLNMGHEMGMDGMLTDLEMQELTKATGAQFDVLYVKGMIAHHQGAIAMAQMVVDSDNSDVKALAEAIIKSQTKQITELQQLLSTLN
jgi:uncharacterized protein (DUF305 family)